MFNPAQIADRGYEAGIPPVLGVRNTGTQARVQDYDSQIFYVDAGHTMADDNSMGLDPAAPLATLQELIDRSTGVSSNRPALLCGNTVYVSGDMSESVVTGTDAQMADHVNIIGVGANGYGPTWDSGAAASPCLDLRCSTWMIQGFEFEVPTASAAIILQEVTVSGYSAYKTQVQNCIFDGLWGGLYGVQFVGAPHRCVIQGNHFMEIRQGGGGGFGIFITDSTETNPYECTIANNRFTECQNHIGSLGGIRGFNVSLFQGNIHESGVLIPTVLYLDLRGGSRGENIVYQNLFMGDYSNTGGYYAHAANPGSWVGNQAEDVLEAEVGDNGMTIAPPAA